MTTPREYHTATLLPNGKVLVAGGNTYTGNVFSSAEVYDPATGTWTATGSMTTPRWGHTATLLPNGKILVTGGFDSNGHILSSTELYNPATGTWTATGSMSTPRTWGQTATLLANGQVLVAGGWEHYFDNCCTATAAAELYDPTTGMWTATGSMTTARANHTATLLPTGQVLVAGGCGTGTCNSAEVYDPGSDTWTATGSMTTPRLNHTATLLSSGQVLVTGGYAGQAPYCCGGVASAELYNPTTGVWTATGSMVTARANHTASLLADGQVLIAGGYNSGCPPCTSLSSAELYNPSLGTFTPAGTMATGLWGHTAVLLTNGQVLAIGGIDNTGNASSYAELYTPGTNSPVLLLPDNLSFGTVQLGTTSVPQTIFLTNNSAVTVTISSVMITGTAPADYATTDTCTAAPIAPNGQCTVTVSFIPTVAGLRSAQLTITDSDASSPQGVSLSGYGASAVASVSPLTLDFGTQAVGLSSLTQTITLSNTGLASMAVSSVDLTGTNVADFTGVETCTAAPLPPNSSCTIDLSFMPGDAGVRTASLRISDDSADSPQTVILTGTGVYPVVGVTPRTLDFGANTLGTMSLPLAVTIANTSTVPLAFSDIYKDGPDVQDFVFDFQASTCPRDFNVLLAPNSSCTIALDYAPALTETAGTSSAALHIVDNAADSPQVVALSGSRASPATATPTTTPLPPSAPPTNTPVPVPPSATTIPPTSTPLPLTAVNTPTPTPLAPSSTPTVRATRTAGTSQQRVALRLSLAHHVVRSGQTLTVGLQTAAHSQATITLHVVTTKVVVTGKGKQRKRVTQTHVLYRVSAKGTADAHGRFTGHLHIAYKPTKAVQAQVLVTVHKGHNSTSRTATVTIQPPKRHK